MSKQKNMRRIPMDSTFIGDKKVLDTLYGKFQTESNFNGKGESRLMEKIKLNKTEWAKELQISRPTLDTKIKYLKKRQLIIDNDEYFEIPEYGKAYFLIPEETLRYLVNTTNGNVIKVYAHLGSLWNLYGTSANFTENSLLELIGYATNKADNHKLIRDILVSLSNNGLISISEQHIKAQKNTIKVYKIGNFSLNYKCARVPKK